MDIKEIRANTRMTQKEFGEYFGISPRTIQNWETNRRTPPEYVVELIKYKAKKERLGMLKLNLLEEGKEEELIKGTLNEIVEFLQENYDDLFSWIEDEENQQPKELSRTELPNFTEVEDVEDLEYELEKVNLDWWILEIKNKEEE